MIPRFFIWIKERPRYIRWWFQRARGKVPECDCWGFYASLADYIAQGLEYLLRENGNIDWHSDPIHKKMKKDLEFARGFFASYQSNRRNSVKTEEAWAEYNKQKQKAFRILSKYFEGLWD